MDDVRSHLERALETLDDGDDDRARFHVRQSLQLLDAHEQRVTDVVDLSDEFGCGGRE